MPPVRLGAPGLFHLTALLTWYTENMDHSSDRVRQMTRRWFNQTRTRYKKFLINLSRIFVTSIQNIFFFLLYDFHIEQVIIRCLSFYTLRVFQKEALLCFNFWSIYFSNVIFRILSFYNIYKFFVMGLFDIYFLTIVVLFVPKKTFSSSSSDLEPDFVPLRGNPNWLRYSWQNYSICLTNLSNTENGQEFLLSCGHAFHHSCILQHTETNLPIPVFPCCRVQIPREGTKSWQIGRYVLSNLIFVLFY